LRKERISKNFLYRQLINKSSLPSLPFGILKPNTSTSQATTVPIDNKKNEIFVDVYERISVILGGNNF